MQSDTLIPLLGAALASGAVLLAGLGIMGLRGGNARDAKLKEKMARFMGRDAAEKAGAAEPSLGEKLSTGLSSLVRTLGQILGPKGRDGDEETRLALLHAGLRAPGAMQTFHGVKAALALGMPLLFLAVCWLLPKGPAMQNVIIGALFLAVLGSYAPNAWLRGRVTERRTQLLCELPDALDLLVVCVESGMGLDQAIHRVSEEMRASAPVISAELRTMTLELRAGRQRHQTLKDLAERTGLEDVQSLTTLLIQADLFGISVARTLRVYSDTLRTGRFQRAEERAAKLPTKLMFPLILCIFPALFVVIMGPAAIQLMQVFNRVGQ